jgi:hypothetical protein
MTLADAEAALAAFQRALLTALATESDGAAIKERLLADPACAPFRDYVASFDPRNVEVVAALSRNWALPAEQPF